MSETIDRELTKKDVIESLKQKMTSGNPIECSGCRITREEYEIIMKALEREEND